MVSFTTTRLLLLAAVASAVPLNINLGAYSPAIVVGDGAIEFGGGGEEGASEAVAAALAQGTVTTSAAKAEVAPVSVSTVAASADSPGVSVVTGQSDSSILSEPASFPKPGTDTKELDPRL